MCRIIIVELVFFYFTYFLCYFFFFFVALDTHTPCCQRCVCRSAGLIAVVVVLFACSSSDACVALGFYWKIITCYSHVLRARIRVCVCLSLSAWSHLVRSICAAFPPAVHLSISVCLSVDLPAHARCHLQCAPQSPVKRSVHVCLCWQRAIIK